MLIIGSIYRKNKWRDLNNVYFRAHNILPFLNIFEVKISEIGGGSLGFLAWSFSFLLTLLSLLHPIFSVVKLYLLHPVTECRNTRTRTVTMHPGEDHLDELCSSMFAEAQCSVAEMDNNADAMSPVTLPAYFTKQHLMWIFWW